MNYGTSVELKSSNNEWFSKLSTSADEEGSKEQFFQSPEEESVHKLKEWTHKGLITSDEEIRRIELINAFISPNDRKEGFITIVYNTFASVYNYIKVSKSTPIHLC